MLLAVALPVGLTFGVATWALMRGRGGGAGFLLCAFFGIVGSFIGGLGGQAIGGTSRAAIGVGTVLGALLVSVIAGLGFGPRPKRAASVDQHGGVAIEQPDHGEAAKTVK